ncbi:hypothetical protein MCEMSE15_01815 [Fimbriimonadaceae bacterium]
MKNWWTTWRATQKAKLLTTLFLGLVFAILMPFVARAMTGQNELTFLSLSMKSSGDLSMVLSPWFVTVIILWVLAGYFMLWPRSTRWEASEVNIEVAKIGKIVMRPNQEVAGLAHRAWTEVVTRKAGMTFDEDHDVIEEVYDSWYQLFGEVRTLIKSIPVEKLRANEDAQQLVKLLLTLLNDVLRPHLTEHQAKFRSWFARHKDMQSDKSPQEVQRQYPEYSTLVESLKQKNSDCLDISKALELISLGKI